MTPNDVKADRKNTMMEQSSNFPETRKAIKIETYFNKLCSPKEKPLKKNMNLSSASNKTSCKVEPFSSQEKGEKKKGHFSLEMISNFHKHMDITRTYYKKQLK